MSVDPKLLLSAFGYEVTNNGVVQPGLNQIAVISLKKIEDGGILRIHGDETQFFYDGDALLLERKLAFPSKVTSNFIYFDGMGGSMRVQKREFVDNALRAIVEYNKVVRRTISG